MSRRWRYLALERPRRGARFRWRDRILSSLGLSLGVLFLILSWGLITPAQELVRTKVLGSLPDRIRATPASVSFGPLAMASDISEDDVAKAKAIPGVAEVYRQGRFAEPCQASATYLGKTLYTDLVLEVCDEGQVAADVAPGYSFRDPGVEGQEIPLIMPSYILDLVNSGISVNTDLPQLSREAVIGKHANLYLGTSSFKRGRAREVRCVIVGVSDQIGAGGPVIPIESAARLSREAPKLTSLTLKLEHPNYSAEVVEALQTIGLRAPRLEIAERVNSVATLLRILGLLLPGAILAITALGLTANLELQVSKERHLIALYTALGATPRQTASLYLVRAASVAGAGLVGGVVGGVVSGRALALYLESKLPPDFLQGASLFVPPWSAFAWSALFCFGVCLLASWLPARNASRVEPAQVFREPG